MNNFERKYGFNPMRQHELKMASWSSDPKDIKMWEEATGMPHMRDMPLAYKNRAIYAASLKEGWTYERDEISMIGLPDSAGKNKVYDPEFLKACSGKSKLWKD